MDQEEVQTEATDSPMQAHADIAGPKLVALSTHIAGEPMRTALAVIPVLDEMFKLTVTSKTLKKQLVPVCKILNAYKKHEDAIVAMKASQLSAAWRQMFKAGSKSTHFCANDLMNSAG